MQTIAAPTICMVMNGGPGTDNHEQDYPEHEGALSLDQGTQGAVLLKQVSPYLVLFLIKLSRLIRNISRSATVNGFLTHLS
jgi:hypothetical protein